MTSTHGVSPALASVRAAARLPLGVPMLAPLVAVLALLTAPARVHAQAREDTGDPAALVRAAPAGFDRAAIIPRPLAFSRNARELLAGMERDALLLGADPFDQLTSIAGIPLHLRTGASIGVFDGPAGTTFVVPVHDAEAFLEGNFRAIEGAAADDLGIRRVRHASDRVLFARPFENHVWLGLVREAVAGDADRDDALALRAAWGATAARLLRRADVFAMASRAGAVRTREDLDALGPGAASLLRTVDALLADAESLLGVNADAFAPGEQTRLAVALDFDPLGLVVRAAVRPDDDWTPPAVGPDAGPDAGPEAAPSRFDHLPGGPSLLAVDVDAAGLARAVGTPPARAVSRIGLMLREPGPGEPLFARALLDVAPAERGRRSIRRAVPRVAWRLLGGTREVAIEAGRLVTRPPAIPPDLPPSPLAVAAAGLLFGPAGPTGVLEDGPADAARLRAGPPAAAGAPLAEDGAIRAMRTMLPAPRLGEAYLDLARASARLAALRPLLGLPRARPGETGLVPGLFVGLPPVGAVVAGAEDALEAGVVVPAPIAAALVDLVTRVLRDERAGGAPARRPASAPR